MFFLQPLPADFTSTNTRLTALEGGRASDHVEGKRGRVETRASESHPPSGTQELLVNKETLYFVFVFLFASWRSVENIAKFQGYPFEARFKQE